MATPVGKVNTLRCPYMDPQTGHLCNMIIKKVQMEWTRCKCGFYFCLDHRLPFDHECTYDHKGDHEKLIQVRLAGEEKPLKVNVHEKGSGSAF